MSLRSVIFLTIIILLLSVAPLSAQVDACPQFVETALERTGDVCADLGRNQVCYGNSLVQANAWEVIDLSEFDNPGDVTDVTNLASLTTTPLDIENETWGIAMMALQANLPDTLPGQNVIFILFGDVELNSEVQPDEIAPPAPIVTGFATGGANLRSGPDTDYAVAGGLRSREEVSIVGRNATGDWLQIAHGSRLLWVFGELIQAEGELNTLPVVSPDAPSVPDTEVIYNRPMQAFRFSTGIGRPGCAEAPRDGVLIQAPGETTVHFLVNGVEVMVGSTVLLNMDDRGRLWVSTFDGALMLTSQGETQIIPPGFEVLAASDSPPSEPQPYVYEEVRNAPVQLLPEQVEIPESIDAVGLVPCSLNGAVTVPAGQPLLLRFGWADYDLEAVNAFAAQITYSVTFDGEPAHFVSRSGPDPWENEEGSGYQYHWYWMVPHPEPGRYDAVVHFMPPIEGVNSITCRVVVS